jgi:hypothetical protein
MKEGAGAGPVQAARGRNPHVQTVGQNALFQTAANRRGLGLALAAGMIALGRPAARRGRGGLNRVLDRADLVRGRILNRPQAAAPGLQKDYQGQKHTGHFAAFSLPAKFTCQA